MAMRLPWEQMTALLLPVVPDEYIRAAVSVVFIDVFARIVMLLGVGLRLEMKSWIRTRGLEMRLSSLWLRSEVVRIRDTFESRI